MTHRHISFFKSATRILGYVMFLASRLFPVLSNLEFVGLSVIIFGEALGVLEEFAAK